MLDTAAGFLKRNRQKFILKNKKSKILIFIYCFLRCCLFQKVRENSNFLFSIKTKKLDRKIRQFGLAKE